MKRIFLVFLSLIVVCFLFVVCDVKLEDEFDVEKNITKAVDLGFIIEEYYGDNYKKYISNGKQIGECVKLIEDKKELNKICERLAITILKKYYIEDKLIIEGYSSKIKYTAQNSITNVQISVKNKEIVIGCPYILGSF